MRTIQYAINMQTGLVISQVGNEVAWPILNYDGMAETNSYTKNYHLEILPLHHVTFFTWDILKWTKKIPKEIKNIHRKFWDFPLLK